MVSGDFYWQEAHRELLALHAEKSSTYGTDSDRLANFTKLGEAASQPPERYAVERLIEKAIRALHMIDAGQGPKVAEYLDLASLALCAEALRMRVLVQVIPESMLPPDNGRPKYYAADAQDDWVSNDAALEAPRKRPKGLRRPQKGWWAK